MAPRMSCVCALLIFVVCLTSFVFLGVDGMNIPRTSQYFMRAKNSGMKFFSSKKMSKKASQDLSYQQQQQQQKPKLPDGRTNAARLRYFYWVPVHGDANSMTIKTGISVDPDIRMEFERRTMQKYGGLAYALKFQFPLIPLGFVTRQQAQMKEKLLRMALKNMADVSMNSAVDKSKASRDATADKLSAIAKSKGATFCRPKAGKAGFLSELVWCVPWDTKTLIESWKKSLESTGKLWTVDTILPLLKTAGSTPDPDPEATDAFKKEALPLFEKNNLLEADDATPRIEDNTGTSTDQGQHEDDKNDL